MNMSDHVSAFTCFTSLIITFLSSNRYYINYNMKIYIYIIIKRFSFFNYINSGKTVAEICVCVHANRRDANIYAT